MTRNRSPRSAAGPALVRRSGVALLSAGLGLLTLAHTAPAWAADEASSATMRWSTKPEAIQGTVLLAGKAQTADPVDGWFLRLLTADGGTAADSLCSKDFSRPQRSFSVECRWDTEHLAGGPAANQHYLVRLMTRQAGALAPAGPDFDAAVANAAAAPENVVAQTGADGRTVLSWSANQEPDLLHYDVEEQPRSGRWTAIGQPEGTTFDAPGTELKQRLFRVAAERRGPDGGSLGPGEWTTVKATRRSAQTAETPTTGTAPGDGGASATSSSDGGRPSPSKPESQKRAKRSRAAAPASGGQGPAERSDAPSPAPRAGDDPATPADSPPTDTPPADRAGFTFSEDSSQALRALAATGSAPRPAPRAGAASRLPATAAASAAPDPGFAPTLPYPSEEAAPEPPDTPEPPQVSSAAPQSPEEWPPPSGHSNSRQRAEGLALAIAGFAVLGLVVRPVRRSRRRPAAARPLPVPVPAPADPDAMADLAARVASLEARFTGAQNGTR